MTVITTKNLMNKILSEEEEVIEADLEVAEEVEEEGEEEEDLIEVHLKM